MYARSGDPMCPVLSFKKYLKKLHPKIDDLWQRPLESFEDTQPTWYCRVALGKNTLSNMMSEISKLGKLSRVYTNHCVRATSITALDNGGIEARHIMRASGHKSESSIRSYACRLSESKKREISTCLSNTLVNEQKETMVNEQKENTPSLDLSGISEDQLLDIFSDDNIFVELNENNPSTSSKPSSGETASVGTLVSSESVVAVPVTQQPLSVMSNTNMYSANGIPPSSLKNTHYLINPNINNSTVHFHFHGQP